MSALKRNWKAIVAFLLLAAAVAVFVLVYRPAKQNYDAKSKELTTMITALQHAIVENTKYADIQDKLPGELEKLDASRLELYKKFPTEMKEEDQIMYVVYLEELFGTEIQFSFSEAVPLLPLSDGSTLMVLPLVVNYNTNYEGFKEMIDYLASDSRITSIHDATMQYDEANDVAIGSLTLMCYILDSELLEYQSPDVTEPSTGKTNIFD